MQKYRGVCQWYKLTRDEGQQTGSLFQGVKDVGDAMNSIHGNVSRDERKAFAGCITLNHPPLQMLKNKKRP